MSYLLDTQHLLWLFIDPEKITKNRSSIIATESNDIYFSQVSLWEISIKFKLGKLKLGGGTPEDFYSEIENSFLICRKIENKELISSHNLALLHRDPFDRLLIWQAIQSNYTFISSDHQMKDYKEYHLKLL
jgi:PIN domain nuclease of toxin-antitoxin system